MTCGQDERTPSDGSSSNRSIPRAIAALRSPFARPPQARCTSSRADGVTVIDQALAIVNRAVIPEEEEEEEAATRNHHDDDDDDDGTAGNNNDDDGSRQDRSPAPQ